MGSESRTNTNRAAASAPTSTDTRRLIHRTFVCRPPVEQGSTSWTSTQGYSYRNDWMRGDEWVERTSRRDREATPCIEKPEQTKALGTYLPRPGMYVRYLTWNCTQGSLHLYRGYFVAQGAKALEHPLRCSECGTPQVR